MLPFSMQTDLEVRLVIAAKAKELRLYYGWKRSSMSERTGVSEASIKRFERTGEISLKSLLRLARTLHCVDAFTSLFPVPEARTINELKALEELQTRPKPQRGRK